MASAVATDKFVTNNVVQVWDHDPGTTNALVCSPDGGTTLRYIDLRDYDHFVAIVAQTVKGGNGVVKLEIVASDAVTFSNKVVIKDSGTIALDTLADWAIEECSAEEVQHLATTYNLRYVAARITTHHAGDEAVVTYIAHARRPHDAITAPYVTA